VASSTPILRLALVLVLMLAALAGVLVTASVDVGWIALVVALVAAPVVVVVDGRSRGQALSRQSESAPRGAVAHGQHAEIDGG